MAEKIKIDLGDEIVSIIPRPGQSMIEAQQEAAKRDPKIAAFFGATGEKEIAEKSVEREFAKTTPEGPGIGKQMLRGGISAAAGMAPMLIPGGGAVKFARMLAESIAPMAAETAMQKTGLAPESGGDIAAAGLTAPLTRGALGFPGILRGGGRGVANFVAPQTMREVGVETLKRRGTKTPSASFFFAEARRQGPVPKAPIIDAIQTAINKEQGSLVSVSRPTVAILKDFQKNVWHSSAAGVSYDDLIAATQRLRQQAEGHFKRGNAPTGMALLKARGQILDAMDEISPAIKKANEIYRREQSMLAITKEMRKTNPGNAIRNLFETDEMVAGSFFPKGMREQALEAIRKGEWEKVPELQKIIDMADRIGRAGTGITMGAFNRMLGAAFEPVGELSQEKGSKAFLRMLMANPRQPVISRTGAGAAAQFGRGAFLRAGEEE